jgi:hypothetical protein
MYVVCISSVNGLPTSATFILAALFRGKGSTMWRTPVASDQEEPDEKDA